ncbi:ricin-type beta-trefoil lectin domain protein [Paraglaciecola arctica]|uniref:ricin-type beta-trefoil lectin domain protein n=1 Tax=Paraglaciecola arctica TaxID=1128911 RepID=UPI001C078F72|nr:ricin-type beta-trefoil lectin domain protein [Paraglaciecola arctica]MBU3002457.1 RICIN domain-containing protein [Paraglaciecola arctica]
MNSSLMINPLVVLEWLKRKQNIKGSLFITLMLTALCCNTSSAAQSNSLSLQMQLGLFSPGSSELEQQMVIYNHNQTKCLSTSGHKGRGKKTLSYEPCRRDGNDTWKITTSGKIKNEASGKCLGAPTTQDILVLIHCKPRYSRDNSAYDFIILDHFIETDNGSVQIAENKN